MKVLLISQEETHPFYAGVHSYFTAPLLEPFPLALAKLSAPPLGITLLAAALKARGISPQVFHNPFSSEEERGRLLAALSAGPFAFCLSTTHLFRPELAAEIYALARRLAPEAHIIAGGPGAEWNGALRPSDGITVFGPAEAALPALLEALAAGKDPETLPNLCVTRAGAHKETPRAAPPPAQDAPFPDWDVFPAVPSRVPVQGSRGCARRCGFCSYNSPYSERTPSTVLAEIRRNRDRWGIRRFRFTDSDLACGAQRALELCRGLEADGGYGWTCFARADSLLAAGVPEAMRRAGCMWVFLGIESGSAAILERMGKGCGPQTMLAGIAAAKKAGLGVHGNFVVGYPGETKDTMEETYAFAAGSGLDTVYFSPFQIRSPGIPALAARDGGLAGDVSGWSHSTMSSSEMLEYTSALTERISADPAAPLPTSEALFSLFSEGTGAEFGANVKDFFGAIRDWNAGRRAGNEKLKETARAKLATHL